MRNISKHMVLLFTVSAVVVSVKLYAEMTHKQVLYINSYNPGFPTYLQQLNGIKSVFKNKNIILDTEFMDTKRFPEKETVNQFHRMLSWKLARLPRYDAVIVADDAALRYAVSQQDRLFRGIPVFFCGINDLEYLRFIGKEGRMKGTVEAVSMKETLLLIKQIFRSRKTLAVITDGTIPGRADMVNFMHEQAGMDFNVKILSMERLSFAELDSEVDALGDDSVILLISAYTDRTGSTRLFEEEIVAIMSHAKVPVFHIYEHGLGDGVFGGKIISHYEQARTAAGMVMRYFEGVPLDDIEIIRESPNTYMFDYAQLERFNVDVSELPAGSVIINKPPSLIELHPFITVAVSVSTGFFILIIMIQYAQRKILKKEVAHRTAELYENRERLTIAMENADQIFWDWNLLTDELVINRNNLMFTQAKDNIPIRTGSEWRESVHPDDRERTSENLRRYFQGEVPFYENIYRSMIGEQGYRWLIARGKIIERDAAGNPCRMTGISTDITHLKNVEDEATRSRAMLRLILDTIPIGVFWKDLNLIYMGCNDIFARYAMLDSSAGIIGKRDSDLIWKDRAEMHESVDRKVIAECAPTGFYEEELVSPAGKVSFLRKLKAPLTGANGEVIGILGIQEDVTVNRRLREQRVRMQKLESVGILAGGLAHDFNNILMGISGSLSVLHLQEKNEKKLHWIQQAERSCAVAADVTSRLITFARGGDPVMEPSDISALIRIVIEQDNAASELQITFELKENMPRVKADERQIGQVLRNLLENAREAVADGGTIHVKYVVADPIAVSSAELKEGSYVQLSVRDTGKGMDSDVMAKVFDPYFSTKDMSAQKGQGLGLTVCHSIVKNHGGIITVESKPGEGTAFNVFLPAI